MALATIIIFLSFLYCGLASPLLLGPRAITKFPSELVYNFTSNTTLENLFLRRNGQLLVSAVSVPILYQIDPLGNQFQTPRIVARFPNVTSVGAIVELEADLFAVSVASSTVVNEPISGTAAIWTVDLRNYQAPSYNPNNVLLKRVASSPRPSVWDGLAIINPTSGLIAATDFAQGTIWLADIQKNLTTPIVSNPILQPTNDTSSLGRFGVNGLKLQDNLLYFTNTVKHLFGRIPVDLTTGNATGNIQTVYDYGIPLDDIAVSKTGNVYLTTLSNQGILRRPAGTPVGHNGTDLVIEAFGTKAVTVQDLNNICRVFFVQEKGVVGRAMIGGPC